HVGAWATDGDNQVVVSTVRRRRRVPFDRAEQDKLLAGIIWCYRDAVIGNRYDQPFRARWCGDQRHGEHGSHQGARHHSVSPVSLIVNSSWGRITSSIAKRMPTASIRSPSSVRSCSPRIFAPARAPNCAPVTPPTIRISASTASTR